MSRNNGPAHEVRFGLIKATVWRKEGKAGTRHNVKLVRLFKDGDSWRESTLFGRDDLPLVAKVADQCHTWIFEHNHPAVSHDDIEEA